MQQKKSQASSPVSLFSRLARWLRCYFLMVGIFVTLLFVAAVYFLSRLPLAAPLAPLAEDASVILELPLEGAIRTHYDTSTPLAQVMSQLFSVPLGPNPLALKSQLRKAANDKRVAGLYVEVRNLHGSLAEVDQLRNALLAFKQSGKKIHLWSEHIDTHTLFLASAADTIYVSPSSSFFIFGPYYQLVYFGDALKKLGVEIEVVRTGNYKSAFEPLIANKPSEATQEMFSSLISDHSAHIISSIKEARNIASTEIVSSWLKESMFDPPQALEKGMVDVLAYADEARNQVKESEKLDFYEYDHYRQHLSAAAHSYDELIESSEKDGIAIITARGEIHQVAGPGGEAIIPEIMNKQLTWAMENEHVKAVLLHIDSPGGSAPAADAIWHDVDRLAQKKPVVVSMGTYAASGGYYIATPAHKIFALPSTETGSIGVISLIGNIHKFEEKYGISTYSFSISNRRELLDFGNRPSPEDRTSLAARADYSYRLFAERVAKGRKMSLELVHAIAQGRVWTGTQAKERGLVDELGDLYDALQETKKLAGFDPETLVPILQWPGFSPSLPTCLVNPRSCLPLPLGLAPRQQVLSIATTANDGMVEDLAAWFIRSKNEPVQALWPGYLFLRR